MISRDAHLETVIYNDPNHLAKLPMVKAGHISTIVVVINFIFLIENIQVTVSKLHISEKARNVIVFSIDDAQNKMIFLFTA